MPTTTRTSFYYDPARQGYDTGLWTTLSGTVVLASILIPDADSSDIDFDMTFDVVTVTEAVTITNTTVLTGLISDAVGLAESLTVVRT